MTCSHFELVMQIKYRSEGFSGIRVRFMQGEREGVGVLGVCGGVRAIHFIVYWKEDFGTWTLTGSELIVDDLTGNGKSMDEELQRLQRFGFQYICGTEIKAE